MVQDDGARWWLQGAGCRNVGYRVLTAACRVQLQGCWAHGGGYRVMGTGFWLQSAGFKDTGIRVIGTWCWVHSARILGTW